MYLYYMQIFALYTANMSLYQPCNKRWIPVSISGLYISI